MDISLIISAFVAGVLTFLAPCTLPLVPAYLGFIGGASAYDYGDKNKVPSSMRRRIFLNGVFYVIGFSAIFIIFGTLAGLAGRELVPYRIWLTRIGGASVIIFGLFLLNVIKIPFLTGEKQIKAGRFIKPGQPLSSLILGSVFAFGWTPCVGPILGSILLLASTSGTVSTGTFLLFIFSLGLAVPFLLVALGLGFASRQIERISPYLKVISAIGGIFLIFLGFLLITNRFNLLISYGYRIFRFINYDRLLDYL